MSGLTRRRAVGLAVAAAGLALMGSAGATVLREASVAQAYRGLAEGTAVEGGETGSDAGASPARRDWAALRAQFPAVAAWVRVGGTPIDLPVAATASEADEGWYLKHDLWGQESLSGTPFLDRRCGGADTRNALAYGHHMTSSDAMFSCLQRAYEQGAFDALGAMSWETPASDASLLPLCALRVEESWPDIQTFSFDGEGAFREWLAGVASQAGAVSASADALLLSATRCVSLVTCSSDWAGQPWRTVAVWC